MTDRTEQGSFLKITPGQRVEVERVLTQSDLDRYAVLSGDHNPIHVDAAFAAQTKFGRTVAHGMLLYSLVEAAVEKFFPVGRHLDQTLKFPTPTYTGEDIRIQLEVVALEGDGHVARLAARVLRPTGLVGLEGQARVLLPGAPWPVTAPGAQLEALSDLSLRNLSLGQAAETVRAFSQQDLADFAHLTGDTNPLYLDPGLAPRLGLPGPLIPRGLLSGLFSSLLGTRLPGPGTNYLKQQFSYLSSAHSGEDLRARVEIRRIRAAKQLINLNTSCFSASGQLICTGDALVLVSDVHG